VLEWFPIYFGRLFAGPIGYTADIGRETIAAWLRSRQWRFDPNSKTSTAGIVD
jgi:hypothetical protein